MAITLQDMVTKGKKDSLEADSIRSQIVNQICRVLSVLDADMPVPEYVKFLARGNGDSMFHYHDETNSFYVAFDLLAAHMTQREMMDLWRAVKLFEVRHEKLV